MSGVLAAPLRALRLLRGANPFNAIFGKELRTTARRKRTYVLRFVYLLALLLLLLLVYSENNHYGGYDGNGRSAVANSERAARIGEEFFFAFSLFCTGAMIVLGPVLTATAISAERLHKTLHVLLMTPITAWQIVSGKLLSRLLVALTLIGLSLPVLAVVRLMGSVEVAQMVGVVAVAASTALATAALGLFFSTLMNRAYAVILLSYASLGFIYLFVPFIIGLVMSRRGMPPTGFFYFLEITNPVFAAVQLSEPNTRRMVFVSWGWCVGGQLATAAGLVMCSARMLRRISRRQSAGGEGAGRDAPESPPHAPAEAVPASVEGRESAEFPSPAPDGVPSPVLNYATAGRAAVAPRTVSDNPVLWREVRRPLMARRWQARLGTILCIGLLALSYLAILSAGSGTGLREPGVHFGFACVFNVLLTLLCCVISATTIAQEKESDTWVLLLATPLSSSAIVWGKLAGVFRRLMWPAILVAAHLLLFTLLGVLSVPSTLLTLWILLTFNVLWIATGVYLSLRLTRVTFAVILNLLLPVLAYAGVFMVGGLLSWLLRDSHRGGQIVGWYFPYSYLESALRGFSPDPWNGPQAGYVNPGHLWLPSPSRTYSPYEGWLGPSVLSWLTAVVTSGLVQVGLSALVMWRAVARFNRMVGRASQREPLAPSPARAITPARVEPSA